MFACFTYYVPVLIYLGSTSRQASRLPIVRLTETTIGKILAHLQFIDDKAQCFSEKSDCFPDDNQREFAKRTAVKAEIVAQRGFGDAQQAGHVGQRQLRVVGDGLHDFNAPFRQLGHDLYPQLITGIHGFILQHKFTGAGWVKSQSWLRLVKWLK
jgi:hypothetical protein